MPAKQLANFVQHKLTVQPLAGDTLLTWDSVSGWPTVGDFFLRLDSVDLLTTEIVKCTAVNVGANQTTVVRAQEGTSASGLFVINSTGGNDLTAQTLVDAMTRLDTAVSQTLTGPLVVPPQVGTAAAATSYGTLPVKVAETILGASGATITLSPLPTGGRDFGIHWYARSDQAVAAAAIQLRLNNISTATYDYTFVRGSNNVASSGFTAAQTAIVLGNIPGSTATASYFGQGACKVMAYAGATGNKLTVAESFMMSSDIAGGDFNDHYSGKWRTTATAVTRLDLIQGAGNFIAGSLFVFWMYP